MAKEKIKSVFKKPRDKKDAMEMIRKHGVKFIRLWFTDIHGQLKSFAVPVDEIEFAWKVIDAIEAKQFPVHTYKKGSDGPEEVKEFEKKHGMRWRS